MKNFLYKTLLLSGLFISLQSFGQCPPGNVTLNSQAQVNQFLTDYPNCTQIAGNLIISGNGISSLSALSNLTSIGGSLNITNTSLWSGAFPSNLLGLHNLNSIGNHLFLQNNGLTTLTHLSGVTSVGGGITIQSENSLTSLQGLNNINSISGTLSIYQNSSLQTLQGLGGLTHIGNGVLLYGNSNLVSLQGLNALTTIGVYIEIDDNDNLSSLHGLEGITSHQGAIIIERNNNLTSLDGLDNLTSVGGNFRIGYTASAPEAVASIQALSNLVSVGENFSILTQPDLTSLEGLENLASVGGNFDMSLLTGLTSLESLENLTSVGGSLNLSLNSNLVTLDGFESLTSVGGLRLAGNNSLTSIEALGNITAVTEDITISSNSNLMTLQGLEGIASVSGNVTIASTSLESLQGLNNLISIGGYLDIYSNNDLLSLEALGNIASVGDYLRINGNDSLITLQGLSNLNSVAASLSVEFNDNLTSLMGLGNLSFIGESLIIRDNDNLASLLGLEGITGIPDGTIEIFNNSSLSSLQGLNNLESAGWTFRIQNNPSLTTLQGLGNLATVGTYFYILNNTGLISLQGIASLTSIGEVESGGAKLRIENNTSLSACSLENICEYIENGGSASISNNAQGCNSVEEIEDNCGTHVCPVGNVTLNSQDAVNQFEIDYAGCTEISGNLYINGVTINDLAPLQEITSITGNLTIHFCSNLLTLEPLENLESVGGDVYISTLINLPNLNGLQNLSHIGGSLSIVSNNSLTDLQGLEGIDAINNNYIYIANNSLLSGLKGIQNINLDNLTHLYIQNHPALSMCNTLPNICEYLYNGGEATISVNTGNCNTAELLVDSCPTTWNGNYWNLDEPDQSRNAVIVGNLTTNNDLIAKNFTVDSGFFTIAPHTSLIVNGKITNNTGSENFIVKSGANLIQNENHTDDNEGAITVERDSQPINRLDYTMWSSPVKDQNLFGFSPNTVNGVTNYIGSEGRIYIYDGANGYVNPDPFTAEAVMNEGIGYLYRAPNNWSQGDPVAYPGKFIGVPNNGDVDVDVYGEGRYTSIGNPYPSNIWLTSLTSLNTLYENNPVINTLYFWNNSDAGGYFTCTTGGCTNILGMDDYYISVGQGFIVETIEESPAESQVTFNNSMRVENEVLFYKTGGEAERHRLWLNLSDDENQGYNQILVGYMTGATNNVDNQIDGKLFGYEGSALYSIIDEEKFVIQGRALPFEDSDVVPLGFRATEARKFIISLTNFDGLFAEGEVTVYLKDKDLNIIHNLMESDYVFESAVGAFKERFEVVYGTEGAMGTGDLTSNSVQIYKQDQNIVVSSKSEKVLSVELYDLQGRNIHRNDRINANIYQIKSNSKGILVVKVQTQNGEVVTKKVINK